MAMVEIGMSLEDFLNSTPYDVSRLFYAKIDKKSYDNIDMRNAFMNGYYNARRGKKDKFIPLNGMESSKGGKTESAKQVKQEVNDMMIVMQQLADQMNGVE